MHFQVLHGCTHPGRVCYGTPVTDRISSRLVFVFLEHVSEPKMACFHDLWNSMFFCVFHRFSIFTIFIKIWKSKFFLVFLNSLNSKNPTFSWVSWFPMVGPKPIVTGPKGFLNHYLSRDEWTFGLVKSTVSKCINLYHIGILAQMDGAQQVSKGND